MSYGPDEMDDANDGEHLETSVTEIQSVEVQVNNAAFWSY